MVRYGDVVCVRPCVCTKSELSVMREANKISSLVRLKQLLEKRKRSVGGEKVRIGFGPHQGK